ncbi:transposase IS4 family protein [Streptomyces sparsogenes DSM 40356]|uniref:Transposase IS4 family protein n=1 Tax=Streptomyces sparsogenes DSM 40356 TaxID=1331668 RepID=A0A1R1SB60_9ACTN|nr:transposase IS4 family protein [Streptomyces sparsogenes DSM 40356]
MAERRPYPRDLSGARWALDEPVLSAWRTERRRHALNIGRPPEHDLREIMNAILYVDRTGCRDATCPTTSRPGKPCTTTSPSGRRTACSPSSPALYGGCYGSERARKRSGPHA